MDPTVSLDLSVDRSSPVPLYFQLSQQLEAAIERGALTPGSLLGNEIELAARLGLSRPTVRQAIQSLVDKGLLVRRRGVGTQVVHSKVRRPLELSSLYDDLEAAGQRPATRVLRTATEPATPEIAAALGVAEGTEVHLVERLRYAHDEPMALLRNHLPPDLLDLRPAELESTGLYRTMRALGITLHSARQSVGARAATAGEARALDEE
nr:GntR family transcriptional regulator [Streptomyces sp. DSM 41633]